MTEAYVFAGELLACPEDHSVAFARYQDRLRSLLKGKQSAAEKFASAFAPSTSFGVGFRDAVSRVIGLPLVSDYLIGRDLRDRTVELRSSFGLPVGNPLVGFTDMTVET